MNSDFSRPITVDPATRCARRIPMHHVVHRRRRGRLEPVKWGRDRSDPQGRFIGKGIRDFRGTGDQVLPEAGSIYSRPDLSRAPSGRGPPGFITEPARHRSGGDATNEAGGLDEGAAHPAFLLPLLDRGVP
jgi:hypothetical protein